MLSQGSEGGLGQSPRWGGRCAPDPGQTVGWDPAGRAGGRLTQIDAK